MFFIKVIKIKSVIMNVFHYKSILFIYFCMYSVQFGIPGNTLCTKKSWTVFFFFGCLWDRLKKTPKKSAHRNIHLLKDPHLWTQFCSAVFRVKKCNNCMFLFIYVSNMILINVIMPIKQGILVEISIKFLIFYTFIYFI